MYNDQNISFPNTYQYIFFQRHFLIGPGPDLLVIFSVHQADTITPSGNHSICVKAVSTRSRGLVLTP